MSATNESEKQRLLTRNRSRVQLVAEQGDDGTYEIRVSSGVEEGSDDVPASAPGEDGGGALDVSAPARSSAAAVRWFVGAAFLLLGVGAALALTRGGEEPADPEPGLPALVVDDIEAAPVFRGFRIIDEGEGASADVDSRTGPENRNGSMRDPGRGASGVVYEFPDFDDEDDFLDEEDTFEGTPPVTGQRRSDTARDASGTAPRRDPLRVDQMEPIMRRPEVPTAPALEAESLRRMQRVPVQHLTLDDLDDVDDEDWDDEDPDALDEFIERYEGVDW